MTEPLRKTFDYLTRSGNPAAPKVLLRALQVDASGVRRMAVNALIRRSEPAGHAELLRRFRSFPRETQQQLETAQSSLNIAVRDALRGSDRLLRDQALDFVARSSGLAHVDSLLRLMLGGGAVSQKAFETLLVLVGRLDETGDGGAKSSQSIRHAREAAVATIADWLSRFRTTPFLPDLVQAVLCLGAAESRAVRHLLVEAEPDIVEAAWRRLETGTARGIARLLCELLQRDAFREPAAEILQRRDEPEFVVQLLRSLPGELSSKQRAAFNRLRRFAWLNAAEPDLDWISSDGQATVARLVEASGLPEDDKLSVYDWMLHHGSRAGRMAASDILSKIDPDRVTDAVFEGLHADDVEVQVWATSKLRERPTPAAFTELIRQLDNPATEVRHTAQEELHSFDAPLLLELFDELTPQVCRTAGALAEKIDPATADELIAHFRHPIRKQRVRAIRAAKALGFAQRAEAALLKLLDDEDYVIRRTTIDVLRDCDSKAVENRLKLLLADDDSRIRDAAQAALNARRSRKDRKTTETVILPGRS